MKKIYDILGEKFNRLTPIEELPKYKGNRTYYKCKCECGNETIVSRCNLVGNQVKSCGCLRKENTSKMFSKHKYSSEKLYKVWKSMKKRCYNKNCKDYKYYGQLGIIVCEEWKDYLNFRNWAYTNGYSESITYNDKTIDRINPYGNYEPQNCRIVDWITQRHNRR